MNPQKKIKNSMHDEKALPQMNSPNNRSPPQNSPNDANNKRSPQQNSQPIPLQTSPASSEKRKQSQSRSSNEQPFFASNLAYYPELPQPCKAKDVNKYLTYEDWKNAAGNNLATKKTRHSQQQQQQQHQHQQKQQLKQQNKHQPKQQQPKQQQPKQQQQKQQAKQQKLQQKQKQKEQKKLQKPKQPKQPKQPRQHQMTNPIGAGHEIQQFDANPYSWQLSNDNKYSSTTQFYGQPKQQQLEQLRQQQLANPIGAGHEIQKFNVNPNPWQLMGDNNYSSSPQTYGQPMQQQEQPKQEQMLLNDNQMTPMQPFGQQKQQLTQEQMPEAIKANYPGQNLDGNSNIWQLFGDNNYESTQLQYGQPKQQEQLAQEMMADSINTNYQSQNLGNDSNIWQLLNETRTTAQPYGQRQSLLTQEELVGPIKEYHPNLDGYSNTWQFFNNNSTTQPSFGQQKPQLTQEQMLEAFKAKYQSQQLDGNSNTWQLFGDNNDESTHQQYGQPKKQQQEQLNQEQMIEAMKSNYQKQNINCNGNMWQASNENRTTSQTYGQQNQQVTQEQLLEAIKANYQNLDSFSNTSQFLNNNRTLQQPFGQQKPQLTQEQMLEAFKAKYQGQNLDSNSYIWQEKILESMRANHHQSQNVNGNSNIWHPLNESGYSYGQPKQQQQREQLTQEQVKPNYQGQNSGGNANIMQLLGEKVYASTLQPNGEPLVPLSMLSEMSGVSLACVFMTAHLIQNHQDPNEYSVLTHFKDDELRSFVVLNDEVKHVLKRYEIREHNLDNVVPNLASPMADNLPQPPTQWMPNKNVKPKPKEQLQNRQTVDARGHDKFINPNLKLVSEWQPESTSYNYKLQSP